MVAADTRSTVSVVTGPDGTLAQLTAVPADAFLGRDGDVQPADRDPSAITQLSPEEILALSPISVDFQGVVPEGEVVVEGTGNPSINRDAVVSKN